jgi:hypothetical protein
MPGGLARGRLDRGGTAQHRKAGVVAERAGIVASGHQQRARAVSADPEQRHELGRRVGEPIQLGRERADLGRQGLVAVGEDAQREHGRRQRTADRAWFQRRRGAYQPRRRQTP